jgi:hypothetical protein
MKRILSIGLQTVSITFLIIVVLFNGNLNMLYSFFSSVIRVDEELKLNKKMLSAAVTVPHAELNKGDKTPVPKTILVTYKNRQALPDKVLQRLSRHNPRFQIVFMSDKDGYDFLQQHYSTWHAEMFQNIPDGPIKADVLRVFYLALRGGYYVDADMVPLTPLPPCEPGGIIVPYDDRAGQKRMLNPCLIVCAPCHPVLEMGVHIYSHLFAKNSYSYWAFSVVHILSLANMKLNFVIPRHYIESCPARYPFSKWHYGCVITNSDWTQTLFKVRDEDYCVYKHVWL